MVKIIIPSRARPQNVAPASLVFPRATWCVGESDTGRYDLPKSRRLVHPDSVVGIGRVRQWILDHVEGPVFMADDDIKMLWCTVGDFGRPVDDPEAVQSIIENCAGIAEAVGAPIFGFDQAWDVRKFHPPDPFRFTGWVGTAVGFIGRDVQYDQSLLSQADIDFCLRALLEKRLIFIDHRFSFVCKRFKNAGGSAGIRSSAEYEAQIRRVCHRWGKWIFYRKVKGTYRLGVRVPRRQSLEIDIL